MRQHFWKIVLITGLIVTATVLHYGVDVRVGAIHDVLLRSYYVPIVLAGLWFGARGGLIAAFAVSVVFFPHAIHGWDAPYTSIFRLIEILMYYVIGGLTGWMSSRANSALNAEKQARLERERAHEALKGKTTQLFKMEEELRRSERLAALGRMSGGLAHEIRNPLASIRTSVEMLQEQCAPEFVRPPPDVSVDLLAVIIEETDRLNRILTEFLRFARAEARQDDRTTAECLVDEALTGTIQLLTTKLETADVVIEFDAADFAQSVAMTEDHLRQIFLNLILNAIDEMPEGGTIRILREKVDEAWLKMAVEDTGPGVPSDVARVIFDPFFSTKEGGVGLGLSIVARMLDSYGGEIKLDATDSGGARFLIALPRTVDGLP